MKKALKKHEKAKKFPEKSYRKRPEDVFDSENVVEVLNWDLNQSISIKI